MPPPPNHVVRFGLPFIMFMVLGTSGLAYVTQGRYDVRFLYKQAVRLCVRAFGGSMWGRRVTLTCAHVFSRTHVYGSTHNRRGPMRVMRVAYSSRMHASNNAIS